MSDLISRKKVIDILEKEKSLRCGYDADIVIFSIEKGIRELPTSYDIDNVVEELEKLKDKGSVTKTEMLITKSCIDKAIEIVKQGSASNDVCRWKFEEETGFAWHCDNKCATYNLVYAKNLKIILDDFECKCPYCGKKIKVVE